MMWRMPLSVLACQSPSRRERWAGPDPWAGRRAPTSSRQVTPAESRLTPARYSPPKGPPPSKSAPGWSPGALRPAYPTRLRVYASTRLASIHPAHAAAAGHRRSLLLFLLLHDDALRRQE